MFKPARMKKLTAIMLERDVEKVLRALKEEGIVQLKYAPDELELASASFSKYRGKVLELLGKVDGILEVLKLVEKKEKSILKSVIEEENKKVPIFEKPIEEFLKEAEEFLNPISNKVKSLSDDMEEIKKKKDKLAELTSLVSILKLIGLSPKDLHGFKKVNVILGIVHFEDLERIKKEMEKENIRYLLYTKEKDKKTTIALFIYEREFEAPIGRILRLHRFEEIKIPKELSTLSLEEAIEKVRKEEKEIIEKEKRVIEKLKNLRKEKIEELMKIRELLIIEKTLDEANLNLGKTKKTAVLSGWVPEHEVKRANEIIRESSKNLCIINISDPEEKEKPPTLLVNPSITKHFEVLTKTYGNPSYNEVDPTSVIAFTFPLVYGFMFGDVGHGLVLSCVGYLLGFKLKTKGIFRMLGRMIMYCGFFSMFAGLLYGSIFGIEGVLHPILGKPPLENISFLIKFALFLGVALLALGCVINIINKLWHGEILVGIFSPWGIMGMWVLLGGTYIVAKNNADIFRILSDKLVLPLVVLPLVAIMVGMVYAEKISIGWGFYEAFEAATRFLFNTISYVRVAVIGVVHSALCLIMVLAMESLPHSVIGYIGKTIVFILGNMVIIIFEGLISFIQTLRLHYYELFSKFFEAKGEEFKPFKVNRRYTILKRGGEK